MKKMTQGSKWKIGLVAFMLAASVMVLASVSRSGNLEVANAESGSVAFSALKPATPEVLAELPKVAKDRIDFRIMGFENRSRVKPEVKAIAEIGPVRDDVMRLTEIGDHICISLDHGSGSCGTKEDAARGELFGADSIGCDRYEVSGVVTDRISRIDIDSGADGSVDESLPVRSNTYIGTVKISRTIASGIDHSGRTVFSVEIPLDEYDQINQGCK